MPEHARAESAAPTPDGTKQPNIAEMLTSRLGREPVPVNNKAAAIPPPSPGSNRSEHSRPARGKPGFGSRHATSLSPVVSAVYTSRPESPSPSSRRAERASSTLAFALSASTGTSNDTVILSPGVFAKRVSTLV